MTEQDVSAGSREPGAAPDEIRAALAEIQASAAFMASRQLSVFLSYVVEKTLAGEADRIKAYSIATEALSRPETFDPASDPIVRVEAGRLRKALNAYYQAEGAGARLRIVIPRGSYVPRFEPIGPAPSEAENSDDSPTEAPAEEAPSAAPPATSSRVWSLRIGGVLAALVVLLTLGAFGLRHSADHAAPAAVSQRASVAAGSPATKPLAPRIFVAPFSVSDEVAVGVTGSQFSVMLATAIARFDEVTVVTRMDGDADYLVSGMLSAGPAGVSASTLLTDRGSGRVIWSSQTTLPRNPIQPAVTINQLKSAIAVAIAQPYGVVLSDRQARTDLPDDGFPCVIRSFNYWRNFTPKVHGELKACLEELTRRYPTYALPYAQLAFVYLDEASFGFNADHDGSAIDRAVKASAMAVQLAPTSARALQALQFTYYSTGQLQRAIETGNRAMVLNPLDTDIRAGQGQVLIAAGRYQLGTRLIEESADRNTAYPPWYDLYLALAAFQGGKTESLRTLIGRVDLPDHPLAAFLAMIAADDPDARKASLTRIRSRFPAMAADPETVLTRFLPNPELVGRLVAAGRQAGLQS